MSKATRAKYKLGQTVYLPWWDDDNRQHVIDKRRIEGILRTRKPPHVLYYLHANFMDCHYYEHELYPTRALAKLSVGK